MSLPFKDWMARCCVGARHFHEAEAARTAGFTIVDQRNGLHGAVLLRTAARTWSSFAENGRLPT